LQVVRVNCQVCKIVAEMPLAELPATYSDQKCPFCKAVLQSPNPEHNGFALLARAVTAFAGRSEAVAVEFVLPDQES
jgi:hypothetical protein